MPLELVDLDEKSALEVFAIKLRILLNSTQLWEELGIKKPKNAVIWLAAQTGYSHTHIYSVLSLEGTINMARAEVIANTLQRPLWKMISPSYEDLGVNMKEQSA